MMARISSPGSVRSVSALALPTAVVAMDGTSAPHTTSCAAGDLLWVWGLLDTLARDGTSLGDVGHAGMFIVTSRSQQSCIVCVCTVMVARLCLTHEIAKAIHPSVGCISVHG